MKGLLGLIVGLGVFLFIIVPLIRLIGYLVVRGAFLAVIALIVYLIVLFLRRCVDSYRELRDIHKHYHD